MIFIVLLPLHPPFEQNFIGSSGPKAAYRAGVKDNTLLFLAIFSGDGAS
ncbi:MAG: hypothetical protein H6619_01575 [Deltaproteobacteria bacterium]|nr:hypothetical protein [Deltaproteobacteria bacterium]